ncbi:hypothetical protein SRHO_G00246360 [Serrasalmus rhombeus]
MGFRRRHQAVHVTSRACPSRNAANCASEHELRGQPRRVRAVPRLTGLGNAGTAGASGSGRALRHVPVWRLHLRQLPRRNAGAEIQMRLKDPFSIKTTDMTKRTNKPKKARDEESSDEVSAGLTCQHVSKAVELNSVKKAVTGSPWSVCLDCMKERDVLEMEQVGTHDIRVCLKCGFQGCSQSESQHSVKHQQAHHSDLHCISISLSTWKAWCFECNEELSTHCNKKALAQTLDFLQKHSAKSASGNSSSLMK